MLVSYSFRFKDVTKEELMERFLPDRIKHGLDILIVRLLLMCYGCRLLIVITL